MAWNIKESKFVHLCFAISFFTSGLIINAIQCILFYGLKPFNKRLYRSIGYYLCYSFYSRKCESNLTLSHFIKSEITFTEIVFIADWWSNSKLYIYIDNDVLQKYVGKEHVLLMMNHSYEIDWLIGWMFCEKSGVLGNCKAYAKKVIQYIPAVGWSWKFAEFVFLERSYDKDKEIIGRQINEIFDYPDPVWVSIVVFFDKIKHSRFHLSSINTSRAFSVNDMNTIATISNISISSNSRLNSVILFRSRGLCTLINNSFMQYK